MINREKVLTWLEICGENDDCSGCCPYGDEGATFNCRSKLMTDALATLKEQEDLKQKMWNALYAEEDKFEKKFVGTEEHDNWFTVYRPWLQRGFEIAIKVIAEQDGM